MNPPANLVSVASDDSDTLFERLRSLERRGAASEDYRRIIEDFLRKQPAVAAALPEFSTFGLLEALRDASRTTPAIEVGRYAASLDEAMALMQRLSEQDVCLCYACYDPNHPYFSPIVGVLGGLFFSVATPGGGTAALAVGVLGAVCCTIGACLVRYHIRNSTHRWERPQWICALHVDRYLQAYCRGETLAGLRLEQLPNPGFRRKAPFYDLHNQIVSGAKWSFRARLRETPPLEFPPAAPESHQPAPSSSDVR